MKSYFLLSIALLVYLSNFSNCYKIDYTNGHNKIHFENNRYLNGKPANEPQLDQAIQTLSQLGFKPDSAQVITDVKPSEEEQVNKVAAAEHGKVVSLSKKTSATNTNDQANKNEIRVIETVPYKNALNPLLPQVVAAATATASQVNPTMDHISAQSNIHNKAYERVLSMKNYLPYFKAKYGLGDDFTDDLEGNEDNEAMIAMPNFHRPQQIQTTQNTRTSVTGGGNNGGAIRELSAFANANQNPYPSQYQPANNYYGGYNNPQQQPQPQPQSQPQPQPNYQFPQIQPLPKLPPIASKMPYGSSKVNTADSSDIFITNINENYNNLNNTDTEQAIVASNQNVATSLSNQNNQKTQGPGQTYQTQSKL